MFDRLKLFLASMMSARWFSAAPDALDTDPWRDGYDAGERSAPFGPPALSADAEASWVDGYRAGQESWQAW